MEWITYYLYGKAWRASPTGWGRVWSSLSILFIPLIAMPVIWNQGMNADAIETSLIFWMVATFICLICLVCLRGYLLWVCWLADGFDSKEAFRIRKWLSPLLRWFVIFTITAGFGYWYFDRVWSAYFIQHDKRCVPPSCVSPPLGIPWAWRV